MGARHGAQSSAVWTSDSAVVLLDGIEANEHGKGLAEARLRALHPLPEGKDHHSTDFEKRLRKIFEKQSGDRVQPWLAPEFWQQEIDNVLVQGIFGRSGSKSGAIDRIHVVWPEISAAWLRARMEEVARAGLPRWVQTEFWATEVDPILLVGVDRATLFRREAVDKALRACPGLPIGAVWRRLRALRNRRNGEPEAVSFADSLVKLTSVARGAGSAVEETSPPPAAQTTGGFGNPSIPSCLKASAKRINASAKQLTRHCANSPSFEPPPYGRVFAVCDTSKERAGHYCGLTNWTSVWCASIEMRA